MASLTAARRYAKGLLQVGLSSKTLDKIFADMQLIQATLQDSAELRTVLGSPVVTDEKKLAIVSAIFGSKVTDTTTRLLELLTSKKRLGLLLHITRAFESIYNDYAGIIQVEITIAYELSQTQLELLTAKMGKATGKKVQASLKMDKNLIGGVSVRFNDTVIDGSVRNKLERMTAMLQV